MDIKPKIVDGKALTGNMILNLAREYTNAINNGKIPTILSSL